ncbi:MAG: RNA polymerase sigma-70 factor (ECF subfamily), partial [Candidatus Paceibacteria bacterium]
MTPQPTHTPAEILEHTGWLRTLARQLVRDPHTADDVVQNTLMAALAWEGVPREGLRNWLAGVARNTARQMARGESRRKYRQAKAAAAEALPSTGEMVELVESQQFLAKAVLDLDEPYRTTIFLRFFDGLSPKEIAARQNIPASTVRVRLKRGLDVLRERLDGDAVGSDRHWSLLLLPLVMPSRSEILAGAILAKGVAQFMGAAGAKALLLLSLVGSVLFVVYQSGTGANNAQEAIEAERLLSREGKIEDQGRSSAVNQREAQFVPTPQSTELTLVAEPGFLVGRVLGTQGETLAAARVTAVSANRRSPSILKFDAAPEWVGETTSDASGIYRIEVQSGHPYLIRAYYKDLAPRQTKAAYAGEVHDMLLDVGLNWTITLRDAVTREPLVEAEVNIQSLDAYRVPRAWGAEGKT